MAMFLISRKKPVHLQNQLKTVCHCWPNLLQEVLLEKNDKRGSDILLWLMVDSWLMIFSSKSWAIRLSDSHTTILGKCLVSMLLSEFPLMLLCISLFFGCLWGNRQHLFSLWRLIRSHYNDLYAFFYDEPFREKSLSEEKSGLQLFSWYWQLSHLQRKENKKNIAQGKTDPRHWVLWLIQHLLFIA